MASVSWDKRTLALSQPDRRKRKRYKIGYLAWIWLVLAIVVPLVIALALAVNETIVERRSTHQNLDKALNQAAGIFHDRKAQLRVIADSLARSGTLAMYVRARDRKGLNSLLTSVQAWDDSFFATFWDTQKQILAQSAGSGGMSPDQERVAAALDRALSERDALVLDVDSSGHARQVLILPVYDNTTDELLGALAVGFFLQDGFVDQIPVIQPDQQVIVLADNQTVFSELDDGEGVPLMGQLSHAELAKAYRQPQATDVLNLNTSLGAFEFKFAPISSPGDPMIVMLGLGVPPITPVQAAGQLLNPIAFAYFLVIVAFGVIGFNYLKGFDSGLLELRGALRRLSEGDWKTRILLDRPDEIGDVAGELDRVRGKNLIAFEHTQNQEREYARIINSMGIAAMQTDAHQKIVWLNPAAEALLKQTKTELEGRSWQSLFLAVNSSAGAPLSLDAAADVEGGIDTPAALPTIAYSGILTATRKKVSLISSPLVASNGSTGLVHIFLDQSYEDELRRSRDEFMLYASHELRTPVAKLRTGIDLLDEAFRDRNFEQQLALLANMQRTLIQFQFFVESLLDSGSVQSGRFVLRSSRTDFKKILNTALNQFQPFLYAKLPEIDLAIDLPSPCPVIADSQRIVLVMFNLLTNAIKYGGESKPIGVTAYLRDGFVITEVTDHGPGISPEEQAQIFERFYRGKRVEAEGLGIGLGLALARTIIEHHGGNIDVKSAPNQGATFWFSIPLAV